MIEAQYHPQLIEQEQQASWQKNDLYKVSEDSTKEKFYCLAMCPYPSGTLHVGHVRNYTLCDVLARYQRMLGKNVLQPMSWDAFGLPAENAAIKHGIPPAKWTYENIAKMREQFKRLGFAYDWSREIASCHPSYYHWEQWLFIKMYERGLVYRKNAVVNWDPVDQTVLANEQVVDGKGWRSGAVVERRQIAQWFIKITDYADQLIDGLNDIVWPEQVKTMQRNWIGRSEGSEIHFTVKDQENLNVFTTRPDTLFGVSFLVIAAQHPLAKIAAKNNSALQAFIEKCQHIKVAEADIATMPKEGLDTGLKAINPLSGELIPIWVANYVLMEYGTGAVMAVPAHDQRDFEFAQQYQLPIKQVIEAKDWDFTQAAYTDTGVLIHSGEFNGIDNISAKQKITAALINKKAGKAMINYRLRDWGISRQRYWGAPIPFIHCDSCGIVPEKEENLPVVLPEEVAFSGATSPLKDIPEFYEVDCPQCGKAAHRETDTFDTFMESSWYFNRSACKDSTQAILDKRVNYWAPVDQYVGGIEHACMHLLYARFIHKVLRDFGFVNSDEPFLRLLTQGMVLKDGAKMSKSKGNTVDPQSLIDQYGADTLRFFVIFTSPPEQSLEWSDSGVEGSYRFLNRVWNFAQEHQSCLSKKTQSSEASLEKANSEQGNIWREINLILKQASYDIERQQLNTVASACMKLLNALQKLAGIKFDNQLAQDYIMREGFMSLLRILNPITPHLTHYLWEQLAFPNEMTWPQINEAALVADSLTLVVQVNGKLRDEITVAIDADQATIEKAAQEARNTKKLIEGKTIRKIIIVRNKLVNIVVEN